jgi:hypothetical protein
VFIWLSEWAIIVRLHHEVASSGTRCSCCKPMVFITLGGYHLLDGLVACDSIEAREKIVWCSEGEFVREIVLTPWRSWRAPLVERVIELPSLVGRFLRCLTCELGGWCQLAPEPPSERSTQRGLACWQIRKQWDKNHCVILVFPLICIPFTQACNYFHIHCALCSCSCN